MAINIIERAIAPHNDPKNRIQNKEKYSLFAPAANVNRVGMAGYSPEYFAVRDQIVELSMAFLGTILQNKVWNNSDDVNGFKEPNIIYSDFTATNVISRKNSDGSVSYTKTTGSLLVVRTNDSTVSQANTEILIAHDKLYLRKVTVDASGSVKAGTFAPIYDKHITSDQLGHRVVDSINLQLNAIGAEHIKDYIITGKKIADDTITADKLADDAVTTDKIENEAVTEDKLSSSFKERIVSLENDAFTNIEYIPANGELIFHTTNGETKSIDLPLELIVSGGRYDENGQSIILTLANGDEIVIPLSDFVENTITQIENRIDDVEREFEILEDEVDNLSIPDTIPMLGSNRFVTSDGIASEFSRFSTAYDKIIQDADAAVVETLRTDIVTATSKLSDTINNVEAIALGAEKAITYGDYYEMVNVINTLPQNHFKPGQGINIIDTGVPDLWVAYVENSHWEHRFIDNESFIAQLQQSGYVQVGYFSLAQKETQKVDLTDYAKKDQVPVINARLKENGAYTLTITTGVE